jgi:7,8-dihydropterin-6-yl-methyl-4-(beta-D-ribofuranosyl)aminobenzene 5'-phosphate synthase
LKILARPSAHARLQKQEGIRRHQLMNIKILYDNQAKDGFKSGWGFAALIDNDTLFDTGENAASLLANMQAFGVKPEQIKQVVLSHEDWDHVGGIVILKQCQGVNVYIPANASRSLKEDIKSLNQDASILEAVHNTRIDSDKFVTATLGSLKKEISLAIRTRKGLVLVTGCAHPGLDNIVEYARQFGDIFAVIGGFHGFSKLSALADVPIIIPCHCTQKKQEMLDMYPGKVRFVSAGREIHVGENQCLTRSI